MPHSNNTRCRRRRRRRHFTYLFTLLHFDLFYRSSIFSLPLSLAPSACRSISVARSCVVSTKLRTSQHDVNVWFLPFTIIFFVFCFFLCFFFLFNFFFISVFHSYFLPCYFFCAALPHHHHHHHQSRFTPILTFLSHFVYFLVYLHFISKWCLKCIS